MSAAEDKIIEFLSKKADAAWEAQQPYLLSLAGPDMTNAGIDYQTILGDERLKAFLERSQGKGRYQVVKHPHQKAKVGLVKHDVDFQFEISDKGDGSMDGATDSIPGQKSVLLDFLHALSRLPPEDIDGIVIPTRVLVKLSRKR